MECAPLGALAWRTSPGAAPEGPARVAVRDSESPAGPSLTFSSEAFRVFVGGCVRP
ncbi:DUF397 domain-containing protein [Streptomyces sp. NPDC055134]